MAYKNDFVLAIKNNDSKVLRENNGKVFLPFYEEYSLLLKNKKDRKAVARIYVDGEDVLNGKRIIIPANGSVDVERYLEDNMDEGRKFQFVPLTDSKIQEKKDHPEIGIVEVIFQREKKKPLTITTTTEHHHHWPYPYPVEPLRPIKPWKSPYWCGGSRTNTCGKPMVYTQYDSSDVNVNCSASLSSCSFTCKTVPASGGTARGSKSTQSFSERTVGELEDDNTTIRLRLVPVETTKTTVQDTKHVFCISCGEKNKRKANFCYHCGNKIEK